MKYTTALIIVMLFLCKISYAQKVTFDYNDNGARVLRFVDLPKPELQTSVIDLQESVIQYDYVKIYPNPVQDFLQIELYKQDVHKAVIVDLFGRIVLILNNLSESNNIDLSHLSSGIYLLKISDKTYKILKE
ncbi:MAG: T9SS type A sorting domain-containing protein [Bacteroidales bacterium]|nr:T9SS type A sorting domain-containing protein [Bacteroidales bacterium]